LNRWQSKYAEHIDFVCIYIAEAHAKEIWPLGNHVDLSSHTTFAERVEASHILTKKYGLNIKMMYDTMSDAFDKTFAVWPERYYLIRDNKMEKIYAPTIEFGFDREKMKDDLDAMRTASVLRKTKNFLFGGEAVEEKH